MSVILVTAAALLFIVPGLSRHPLGRLAPSERSRIGVVTFLAGIGLSAVGLALCAAPILFGIFGLSPIGPIGLRHFFPGGSAAGWVSLVTLLALIALTARAVIQHLIVNSRVRAASRWMASDDSQGVAVRVLPTDTPIAVAVPGRPSSIVISNGTLSRLEPDELDAVMRHEISHLTHRHQRYLLVATVVEQVLGWIPPVARSAEALRLAIEQWADEDAVVDSGDRKVVSSAMRRIVGLTAGPSLASFSDVRLLAGRLRNLESAAREPSRATRAAVYLMTAITLVAAVGSLIAWIA